MYAKRSPLEEALHFARTNFRVANSGAPRPNWWASGTPSLVHPSSVRPPPPTVVALP